MVHTWGLYQDGILTGEGVMKTTRFKYKDKQGKIVSYSIDNRDLRDFLFAITEASQTRDLGDVWWDRGEGWKLLDYYNDIKG